MMSMYLQNVISKKKLRKNYFFVDVLKDPDPDSLVTGMDPRIRLDPDPYQNVMNPQH